MDHRRLHLKVSAFHALQVIGLAGWLSEKVLVLTSFKLSKVAFSKRCIHDMRTTSRPHKPVPYPLLLIFHWEVTLLTGDFKKFTSIWVGGPFLEMVS